MTTNFASRPCDEKTKPTPLMYALHILHRIIRFVFTVILAITCGILFRAYIAEHYEVPTESMMNTIQVGDHLIGYKRAYAHTTPQRTDIITFPDPESPRVTLIKRIIGLPGDVIDLKSGQVFINGKRLNEPYAVGKTNPLDRIKFPYTVPNDSVFCMGDNRENSSDSRHFGTIKIDNIESKIVAEIYPLKTARLL